MEGHWLAVERPIVHASLNERQMDMQFEKLLEAYPMPDGYNVAADVDDPPEGVRLDIDDSKVRDRESSDE